MCVHTNVSNYVPDMPNNTKQKNAALEPFFTAKQRVREQSVRLTLQSGERSRICSQNLNTKKKHHITNAKKKRNKKTFLKAVLQVFGFKYRLYTVCVSGMHVYKITAVQNF